MNIFPYKFFLIIFFLLINVNAYDKNFYLKLKNEHSYEYIILYIALEYNFQLNNCRFFPWLKYNKYKLKNKELFLDIKNYLQTKDVKAFLKNNILEKNIIYKDYLINREYLILKFLISNDSRYQYAPKSLLEYFSTVNFNNTNSFKQQIIKNQYINNFQNVFQIRFNK